MQLELLPPVLPGASGLERVSEHWYETRDGDAAGIDLYERHYSCHHYADGRERTLFVGPGEKTVLLGADAEALFVWRKFVSGDGQQGVNCAVFRNEGTVRSSLLIEEAMQIAWQRWPGERLFTYVSGEKIRSANPGYCFKMAGWSHVRDADGRPLRTRWNRLWILEVNQ